MRQHATTITIALALAGCGTNPCDIGLLYENMTPEQQASCDQCSNANECPDDEDGETGEDEDSELMCSADTTSDIVECLDAPALGLAGWVSRALSTCGELSQAYDTRQAGLTFDTFLCEALVFGSWTPTEQSLTNDGWHICWNPYFETYRPARTLDVDVPTPDWTSALTCSLEADVDAGSCPMGFVSHLEDGVTCKCLGSDDACQPGTVCEGNYTLFAGWDWPRPTECVWDGGPFGYEVGPDVYGLTTWADGLTVERDSIVISPSLLLTLWPQEGEPFALFNDDQRADERGMITHCGGGSLCEHLDLHVGERIVFDGFDVDALLAGRATQLEVERPRNRSRWLTISVK